MKVKRYVAANSREAMAQVKKDMGSDAVILSNRPVAGGVEILALAQGDVAGLVTPREAPRPAFATQPSFVHTQRSINSFGPCIFTTMSCS